MQGPFDPRFGSARGFAQNPQPAYAGAAPQYATPAPHAYGQQAYANAQMQQPGGMGQGHPVGPQPGPASQGAGGWGAGMAGNMPRFNMPGGLGGALGNVAGGVAQPSGLPAPISFGLALAAVVVALVFDVVFLKIHIPGVGGYAWYLTTALSFAGAGWASIMWTRAGKTLAMTALVVAGIVYGIADLGLGLVLEDLSMAGAIVLGAQGVAIACVCGFGGIFKALRAKGDGSA